MTVRDGMQMGSSGFGLTHGYGKDDDKDDDVSHEFKGAHGVSNRWIAGKVLNSKASPERQQSFHSEMKKRGAAQEWAGHKKAAAKRKFAADISKKESGWDRWKAKKGHGLEEGRHEDR